LEVKVTTEAFCLSHPRPDGLNSCVDATGAFKEGYSIVCKVEAVCSS